MTLDFVLQLFTAITGLIGQFLITKHRIQGFYFWIASNIAFMLIHYMSARPMLITLHAVYILFCIWGSVEWHIRNKKPEFRRGIVLCVDSAIAYVREIDSGTIFDVKVAGKVEKGETVTFRENKDGYFIG